MLDLRLATPWPGCLQPCRGYDRDTSRNFEPFCKVTPPCISTLHEIVIGSITL
jgi:hypothetical protein